MFSRMFAAIVAALVLTTNPQGAQAQQALVQCTKTSGSSGWVPDAFTYAREGTSKKVTVSDPLILAFMKVPVTAKVRRDNARQLVLTWKVKGVRDRRGSRTPALAFRAVINKSDLSYKVVATPLGYPDTFTGSGRCAVVPAAQVKALTAKIKSAGKAATQNGGMLHTLWKSGQNRSFSCKVGKPRKAYDWSATQVAIRQKAKADEAVVEYTTRSGKAKTRAKVKQSKKFVTYVWAQTVADKKGQGFTEPLKATVQYKLSVDMKSGRASLQSSAAPSRRKSSSRVPVNCK
ncbi:hypothetical protein BDE40_0756 [Litoreibacter halocynthiae]|uniref:Uncharacterized protein n=1 Tax=Litoreibacter halocynthiae TaxID=1242689 RepID=A0A4R7LPQ8_9RHOB|nr:hypothetical protein [Litoreibacter halocynthiae]TDT77469.1 hypothetical protein BDE40_0756 [Litoreibacter halocynthiae]